jgi:hypothetical protein
MEESIVFNGQKTTAKVENNFAGLNEHHQRLLLQKSLLLQRREKETNRSKIKAVQTEIESIDTEIKAVKIELRKFKILGHNHSEALGIKGAKKRLFQKRIELQKTLKDKAFPVNEDWESRFQWLRTQLFIAMNLLCSPDEFTEEEREIMKIQLGKQCRSLSDWETVVEQESYTAMKLINKGKE